MIVTLVVYIQAEEFTYDLEFLTLPQPGHRIYLQSEIGLTVQNDVFFFEAESDGADQDLRPCEVHIRCQLEAKSPETTKDLIDQANWLLESGWRTVYTDERRTQNPFEAK